MDIQENDNKLVYILPSTRIPAYLRKPHTYTKQSSKQEWQMSDLRIYGGLSSHTVIPKPINVKILTTSHTPQALEARTQKQKHKQINNMHIQVSEPTNTQQQTSTSNHTAVHTSTHTDNLNNTMTDSKQENQHNNNNNISHTNTHTGNTDIDVHMLDHQPASIIHTEAHTDANSHTDDEQQWIVQHGRGRNKNKRIRQTINNAHTTQNTHINRTYHLIIATYVNNTFKTQAKQLLDGAPDIYILPYTDKLIEFILGPIPDYDNYDETVAQHIHTYTHIPLADIHITRNIKPNIQSYSGSATIRIPSSSRHMLAGLEEPAHHFLINGKPHIHLHFTQVIHSPRICTRCFSVNTHQKRECTTKQACGNCLSHTHTYYNCTQARQACKLCHTYKHPTHRCPLLFYNVVHIDMACEHCGSSAHNTRACKQKQIHMNIHTHTNNQIHTQHNPHLHASQLSPPEVRHINNNHTPTHTNNTGYSYADITEKRQARTQRGTNMNIHNNNNTHAHDSSTHIDAAVHTVSSAEIQNELQQMRTQMNTLMSLLQFLLTRLCNTSTTTNLDLDLSALLQQTQVSTHTPTHSRSSPFVHTHSAVNSGSASQKQTPSNAHAQTRPRSKSVTQKSRTNDTHIHSEPSLAQQTKNQNRTTQVHVEGNNISIHNIQPTQDNNTHTYTNTLTHAQIPTTHMDTFDTVMQACNKRIATQSTHNINTNTTKANSNTNTSTSADNSLAQQNAPKKHKVIQANESTHTDFETNTYSTRKSISRSSRGSEKYTLCNVCKHKVEDIQCVSNNTACIRWYCLKCCSHKHTSITCGQRAIAYLNNTHTQTNNNNATTSNDAPTDIQIQAPTYNKNDVQHS